MTDDLMESSHENISIFSLLDVLKDEKESLYGDPIHFRSGADFDHANNILAKAMARDLSKARMEAGEHLWRGLKLGSYPL